MSEIEPGQWTWLEITKIGSSLVTPIIVAYIGFLLTASLKKLDQRVFTNQKLIEKRIAIYDKVAPMLNDLYCYYLYVGNWKELNPTDIVSYKRSLDKEMYIYIALFPEILFEEYNKLIHLFFATFQGIGHDARLKSRKDKRRAATIGGWIEEWEDVFVPSSFNDHLEKENMEEIKDSYHRLMRLFSAEIGARDFR